MALPEHRQRPVRTTRRTRPRVGSSALKRSADVWRVPAVGRDVAAAALRRPQVDADRRHRAPRVDEGGAVVLGERVEQRGEVGPPSSGRAAGWRRTRRARGGRARAGRRRAATRASPRPARRRASGWQSSSEVGQHVGIGAGEHRRDALGDVHGERLRRPVDAVPRRHAVRRRQADPAAAEALHHEGAGRRRRGGRPTTRTPACARSRPAGRHRRRRGRRTTTARRRAGGRRRAGRRRCRRARAARRRRSPARPAREQRAVARGDALVGVRVPGVVELGEQQLARSASAGSQIPSSSSSWRRRSHAAGVGVELGHATSLPDAGWTGRHRSRSMQPDTSRRRRCTARR